MGAALRLLVTQSGHSLDYGDGLFLLSALYRRLNRRDIFKQNRAAALAEWCELMG